MKSYLLSSVSPFPIMMYLKPMTGETYRNALMGAARQLGVQTK